MKEEKKENNYDRGIDLMEAFTDLPEDMLDEAAWSEDEFPAGGRESAGSRHWLPIFNYLAAALVIGLISWILFSGSSRESAETKETQETTEVIGNEMPSGFIFEYIEEELVIPEGFEQTWSEEGICRFTKYYNGIETSDRIVYNSNRGCYVFKRNEISDAQLSTINFELIDHNRTMLQNSGCMNQYNWSKEYITVIDGRATVVVVGSKIVNHMLEYDCFDLGTYEDISDQKKLIADLI